MGKRVENPEKQIVRDRMMHSLSTSLTMYTVTLRAFFSSCCISIIHNSRCVWGGNWTLFSSSSLCHITLHPDYVFDYALWYGMKLSHIHGITGKYGVLFFSCDLSLLPQVEKYIAVGLWTSHLPCASVDGVVSWILLSFQEFSEVLFKNCIIPLTVCFYFQTLNPELPALDMSLMETSPGMENVRVRVASVMGRVNMMLRAIFLLMQFEGRDQIDSTGWNCPFI